MNILGTDFISYEVSDVRRALAFYRDVLGLTVSMDACEHGFAELDVGGVALSLFSTTQALGRPPRAGGGMIWLAVPDMAAAIAELKEKGVLIAMEPLETPVCHMAIFHDPDGNEVGLHHRKDGTVG